MCVCTGHSLVEGAIGFSQTRLRKRLNLSQEGGAKGFSVESFGAERRLILLKIYLNDVHDCVVKVLLSLHIYL